MRYEAFQLRARCQESVSCGPLVTELSIGQLADITGGTLALATMPPLGGHLEPIGPVVIDSRQIAEGDMFWGLQGAKTNGAHFVEDAFLRAASGAVVGGRTVEPWAGKYCIHVDHAEKALLQLARWVRCQFPGYVVAVVGADHRRTTTGAMIAHVMRSAQESAPRYSHRSCHVQTALAILDWRQNHDCTVVEIPTQSPHKIREISHLCSPHITAITSAHNTHRETASSREAIATNQDRLLQALPSDGLAVLNGDDPHLRTAARKFSMPMLWVGNGPDCDIVAKHVHERNGKQSIEVDNHEIVLPLRGQHSVTAALTAYAVGRVLSVPMFDLIDALESFEPLSARDNDVSFGQVQNNTRAA